MRGNSFLQQYCLLTFFQGDKNLLAKDIVENVYCCTLRTKAVSLSF